MTGGLRRLLAALVLAATLAPAAAQPAPAASADPDEQAAAHQVLVLLQLPPPHFRPDAAYSGSSYGDGPGRAARRRLAAQLAREHGLQLVTAWPMPLLGVDCVVMRVPAEASAEQAAQRLSADQRVAWAQPMHLYRTQQQAQPPHDDPLYRVQPVAQAWHLAQLHTVATGRQVSVAVVDSGVDAAHPDLAGQVATRENFLDRAFAAERHGTGVAGVIAARADNGIGIAGVAPGARLLALRACWQQAADDSLCNTLSLAQALHYAIEHGAQVINLSLTGPADPLLARLLDVALARGISIVSAADRALPGGGFPASHPGVVAVVARGGPIPAGMLAAPGDDVPTTTPGGRWQLLSGSSFAAAHVSGLLALLREAGRTPRLQRAALVGDGSGGIDACATLRVMNACVCGCGSARAEPAVLPARP